MLLSDAIVLGSTSKKLALGKIDNTGRGTCALGMAGFAIGHEYRHVLSDAAKTFTEPYDRLRAEWPWLTKELCFPCSCELGRSGSIVDALAIIYHISDSHICDSGLKDRWTIERLVNWIKSVEPEEANAKEETKDQTPLSEMRTNMGLSGAEVRSSIRS